MTSDSEEGIIRWRDLPKEMPFSSPSVKKVTDSVELKKKKKESRSRNIFKMLLSTIQPTPFISHTLYNCSK